MRPFFTEEEEVIFKAGFQQLKNALPDMLTQKIEENVLKYITEIAQNNTLERNSFGFNPIICSIQTALISINDIGLKLDSALAIIYYVGYQVGMVSEQTIVNNYGENVLHIIKGIARIKDLYHKKPIIESENFRNLLVSFAEDMRVILIMIADRVNIMRQIRDTKNTEARKQVSEEASYLYAPLAHKLGLYKLKSELEDLSLKYLEHDVYYHIKDKLNQTKRARDQYIKEFIDPVSKRLSAAGLDFHIKGRTKSIHSIWQKMKKQKCNFEGIYDLFAIRIILKSPEDKEKMQCWQTYSIITDMYQPNPKRLRDWISVPKSNGYECLHITVLGPKQKWVEVQIRTERMDDIAEHGLAAHWRYKGVKAEGGLDNWLASIRAAIEAGNNLEVMDQFKLDLYDKEIYVFTPKGDLLKFPKGATLLDFAYAIHSKIGNQCIGGKVNHKNVSLRTELKSGDTVEIMTSNNQTPKQEWLKIAKSAKAKTKIRLALKENQVKAGIYVKELLERRFKNKKIEFEEQVLYHLIKQLGFKEVSDFYKEIADEKLDVNDVIDEYVKIYNKEHNLNQTKEIESAKNFEFEDKTKELLRNNEDILVIGKDLKGIDFSLSKCCHPIYGDPIFGFVTISGGIRIHRTDCPNAPDLQKRYGYRIVKARWSGKGESTYDITLRIIGNDDIGIVSNITNIISKENNITMRSINIDTNDGLFSGTISVMVEDTSKLKTLIKKVSNIKGVKQVTRL